MLDDVWSDVGKAHGWKLSTSLLLNCEPFHTGYWSEVESFQHAADSVDAGLELCVGADGVLNFFQAVDNSGMISPTEGISYFHKLSGQELTREIHSNLSGRRKIFRSRLRAKAVYRYSPLLCNCLLDGENGQSRTGVRLEAFDSA